MSHSRHKHAVEADTQMCQRADSRIGAGGCMQVHRAAATWRSASGAAACSSVCWAMVCRASRCRQRRHGTCQWGSCSWARWWRCCRCVTGLGTQYSVPGKPGPHDGDCCLCADLCCMQNRLPNLADAACLCHFHGAVSRIACLSVFHAMSCCCQALCSAPQPACSCLPWVCDAHNVPPGHTEPTSCQFRERTLSVGSSATCQVSCIRAAG